MAKIELTEFDNLIRLWGNKQKEPKMTDFSRLDNWEDNEAIFINKGLQKRSRFAGEA